jgi:TonB-linked SusC/RagA family outer membrane protein
MKRLLLLLLFTSSMLIAFSQVRTVTGKVTDESGAPLPNVSVVVKGSSNGTTTDENGSFSISVPPTAKAIVVSSVNFSPQEVTVAGKSQLTVKLIATTEKLNEVVVVAYGTVRKGAFTGSAATVDAKKIEQRPILNVSSALAGAAPGVGVNAGSGQPGSGPAIRVRGFGSINASNDPLYVVDGVPYDLNIANLNVEDIESISVLKDAASTSLYGSRAANGVIVVTTKKGRKNVNQLTAKVTQGTVSRGIPEYSTVDAYQYYPLMWEAYRNSLAYSGTTPIATANQTATNNIKGLLGYNPFNVPDNDIVRPDGTLNPNAKLLYPDDLDWFGPLLRKGSRGDYAITMNGGSEKNDYYISLGYTNEKGFVIKSDYERYTARVNVNTQPLKWFRSGLNVSTAITKSNQAITSSDANLSGSAGGGNNSSYVNPFSFARSMAPIYPVYLHDPVTGAYVLDVNGNRQYDIGTSSATMTRAAGGSPGRHVLEETVLNDNLYQRNAISGRTFGEITFLHDFKLSSNISVDVSNYRASRYENKIVGDAAPAGRSSRYLSTTTSITFNQLLNYNKAFGSHTFDVLAGHENYDFNYEYINGTRSQQSFEGITELGNFTTTNDLNSYTDKDRIESYFGRVNYSYSNKYLLSASLRRDGSSRFAKDVRWGTFWSVGGGWRLDQESFMKGAGWVSLLKLRSSYGGTGNYFTLTSSGRQNYYPFQGLYDLGYDNVANPGVLQSNLPNNKLTWETNKQFDVGVDFGLFKNRLRGSFEYFNRKSDNLLFNVPLPVSSGPLTSGFATLTQNIGSMYNRGFELQLGGDVVSKKDFTWSIDVNATTFKNQITKMPETQPELIVGTSLSGGSVGSKKLAVGHSVYDYWLREYRGVDPADGAALYTAGTYTAATGRILKAGDTVTTSAANAKFHYAGSAIPDVYGGITNTFTYRDFSLSALFTYQLGGKVFDYNYENLMTSGATYGASISSDIVNRWQKPGDITDVPRLDVSKTTDFNAQSDRWLISSSYLALRSATLTYNLPKRYATSIHTQNARVYLSGENLFMSSARKGLNPTQSFTGVTSNGYIPSRIITLGLNVTL